MTDVKKSNTSIVDRLRVLGPVFSLQDMVLHFNITSEQASVYLNRWSQTPNVKKFGPGVAFNLLFHPDAVDKHMGVALTKVLRRPFLMVGGSSIYHSGWTTQVHRQMEIAVPIMRGKTSLPKLSCGVKLVPRSVRHFNKLNAQINAQASGGDHIPVVMPAYALADAYIATRAGKGAGLLTPADEIDKDYLDDSEVENFRSALCDLGASEEEIAEAIEEYEACLDPDSEDSSPGFF
jgi:hypothetical protein